MTDPAFRSRTLSPNWPLSLPMVQTVSSYEDAVAVVPSDEFGIDEIVRRGAESPSAGVADVRVAASRNLQASDGSGPLASPIRPDPQFAIGQTAIFGSIADGDAGDNYLYVRNPQDSGNLDTKARWEISVWPLGVAENTAAVQRSQQGAEEFDGARIERLRGLSDYLGGDVIAAGTIQPIVPDGCRGYVFSSHQGPRTYTDGDGGTVTTAVLASPNIDSDWKLCTVRTSDGTLRARIFTSGQRDGTSDRDNLLIGWVGAVEVFEGYTDYLHGLRPDGTRPARMASGLHFATGNINADVAVRTGSGRRVSIPVTRQTQIVPISCDKVYDTGTDAAFDAGEQVTALFAPTSAA